MTGDTLKIKEKIMGDEFVKMAKTMDLVGLGQVGLALAGVTIVAQAAVAVTQLAVGAIAVVPDVAAKTLTEVSSVQAKDVKVEKN